MAFPIRTKAAIPPGRLGRALDGLHRWLGEKVGPGEHAGRGGHGLGTDALCLCVRRSEDLARCLAAFPQL